MNWKETCVVGTEPWADGTKTVRSLATGAEVPVVFDPVNYGVVEIDCADPETKP